MSEGIFNQWPIGSHQILFGTTSRRDPAAELDSRCKSSDIFYLNQVHGGHVLVNPSVQTAQEADAIVTNRDYICLAIKTADCLPVLAAELLESPVIGAAHAGWRGLKEGVLLNLIDEMRALSRRSAGLKIYIGPCIRACCYEVGAEMADHFDSSYIIQRSDKIYLNLPEVAKAQLTDAGVKRQEIADSGLCTACLNSRFFSFRREGDKAGRIISWITRQPVASGARIID